MSGANMCGHLQTLWRPVNNHFKTHNLDKTDPKTDTETDTETDTKTDTESG